MLKRLLIGLICWLLGAQLALAAVTITNSDNVIGSQVGGGTTITWAGFNSGVAAADRITAISIAFFDSTNSSISIVSATVTIALTPTAMTCTASATSNNAGALGQSLLCYLLNPTLTSSDFVMTLSAGCGGCYVELAAYSITGANTVTPVSSTNTASDPTGGAPSTSITIPAGGALLASSQNTQNGSVATGPTWTNATTDQVVPQAVSSFRLINATGLSTTAGSPTVTATWTQSGFFTGTTLSLVAFQQSGVGVTPHRARRGYGK